LCSVRHKITLDTGTSSGVYAFEVEAIRIENDFLLAGELARQTGLSTDTLRHYERKKVLAMPRRLANGYRMYPATAVERVHLVQRALSFGFTLDELALILAERDSGGSPCGKVRALAAQKLAQVEEQLKSLKELRRDLRTTLADWDDRLSAASGAGQKKLLEKLPQRARSIRRLSPISKRKKGR